MTGPRLRIRPARRTDLPALLEIERLSYADPWEPRAFEDELHRRDGRLMVLRHDIPGASPLGFINYWLLVDQLHVLNVAVHPEHRRHGLGRRLMDHAERVARRRRLTDLTLEVRPTNTAARALYFTLGFHQAGRRPRYYPDNEDALILIKPLL